MTLTNETRTKNHMIMLTDAEKAFEITPILKKFSKN
jgi:hypothetical protein